MNVAAMLAQLYAMRAQVDALIVMAQTLAPEPAAPLDPAEICPVCGASGDSQLDTSTLDGTRRRRCAVCRAERVLN